jgi:predicted  nucleic acid-binding Zn-ribbon protein
MPHQCLKCGSVFADGSPAILRGCPQCKGMKFFYTEKAISEDEREQLREKAQKDIKHLIHEMLAGEVEPSEVKGRALKKDEWVRIDIGSGKGPMRVEDDDNVEFNKDAVKSIEGLLFGQKDHTKKFRVVSKTEEAEANPGSQVKAAPQKKAAKKAKDKTAVITIHDEGVYDIDIEKLLDKSPLIVQKDGSYLVHLPSAFKRLSKKRSTA